MNPPLISKSSELSSESARERLRLARVLFAELTTSYRDWHDQIERRLSSSSPGSQGVRSSPSQGLPSQT